MTLLPVDVDEKMPQSASSDDANAAVDYRDQERASSGCCPAEIPSSKISFATLGPRRTRQADRHTSSLAVTTKAVIYPCQLHHPMADDDTVLDGAASGGIQRLTKRLYEALVRDMVSQTVDEWRLSAKRHRAQASSSVCSACGHHCALFSPTLCPATGTSKMNGAQDTGTSGPNGTVVPPAPSSGSSSTPPQSATTTVATPSGSSSQAARPDLYAQNPLFECVVCSRQVSSNRYAVHLAKCLGIGSSGKAASASRKQALSARNSPAPNATSDTSSLLLSTPRVQAALDARKRLRAPDGHLLKPPSKRGESSGRGRGRKKSRFHAPILLLPDTDHLCSLLQQL